MEAGYTEEMIAEFRRRLSFPDFNYYADDENKCLKEAVEHNDKDSDGFITCHMYFAVCVAK